MTTKVFISYRRGDVDAETGRLRDFLEKALGKNAVFQDVSRIAPGQSFPNEILDALQASRVILAVIGPGWLGAHDEFHRRRLDKEEDWVRKELSIALDDSTKTVIPVLLNDTKMPPAAALPEELAFLSTQNAAMPIQTDTFERDVAPLIEHVTALCNQGNEQQSRGEKSIAPYLEWVRQKYSTVELLGLDSKESSHSRLRLVYVPAVTNRPPSEKDQELLEDAASKGGRNDDNQTLPLLLQTLADNSAYIPGEPGAGKSTFCRWFMWIIANGAVPAHSIAPPDGYAESLPESLTGKLPLLVALRDFATHLGCQAGEKEWVREQLEIALAKWLDLGQRGGLTGELFREQLDSGQVVLALDGVDEVATTRDTAGGTTYPRACLLSALADALGPWQRAGNRVVLTSRPYGLNGADVRRLNVPEQSLAALPSPLQDLFIERWYAATDADRRDTNTRGLKNHLAGRQHLRELTESPLLLTALCIRYGQGQRLPDDLFDLYEGLVSSVLYSRYSEDRSQQDKAHIRLAAIAYGMHTGTPERPRSSPQAQVHKSEADEHLRAFAAENLATEQGHVEPAERRRGLLENSGLLQSADKDNVQFYHLSFQEFLAADHILRTQRADDALLKVLQQRGQERGWRPTLMYLFTGLVKRNPQQSVDLLTTLANGLSREDVASNPSLAAFVAQAAELLINKSLSLGTLADTLKQLCLYAIADEVAIKDRWVLGMALGVLGDPRVAKAKDLAGFVEIPAGQYRDSEGGKTIIPEPFLLGRFAVTNGQYREFMEADGYSKREYWSEPGWEWLSEEKVSEPRYWHYEEHNRANQPVTGVSFFEAEAYCNWMGGRLPTSDEWGAAAGGQSGREYPWGPKWRDGVCNTSESSLNQLAPVGLFPGSRQADADLHDMAGNVWEWCDAFYDPSSKNEYSRTARVVRGGSWINASGYARAADRSWNRPDLRVNFLGFRVLCSSPILSTDH